MGKVRQEESFHFLFIYFLFLNPFSTAAQGLDSRDCCRYRCEIQWLI